MGLPFITVIARSYHSSVLSVLFNFQTFFRRRATTHLLARMHGREPLSSQHRVGWDLDSTSPYEGTRLVGS